LFFRPGAPFATELAREFDHYHSSGKFSDIRILGVVNDTEVAIQQFKRVNRLTLPILRDPGSIFRSFGVGQLPTVVLIDSEHFIHYRLDGFVGRQFRSRLDATEVALRALPSVPKRQARIVRIRYGKHPKAPVFAVSALDGARLDLVALRGSAVVLIFFDNACGRCDDDLPRIASVLREFRQSGAVGIGVLTEASVNGAQALIEALGPDIPVVLDATRSLVSRYRPGNAPELVFIDRHGMIRDRLPADAPLDPDMLRRQIRVALSEVPDDMSHAGTPDRPPPRIVHVGDGACRDCHREQYLQWRTTRHAGAFTRLLQEDRQSDPGCTPCHTTGAGLTRGFGDDMATASMLNVQCEVCHGPGKDHVNSPAAWRSATIYGLGRGCVGCDTSSLCATCHDAENDPDFDFESALARIRH
jgi:peroxiredoxin